MIVDGITIAAGGGIKVQMIDGRRGTTLPGTASVGDLWELTELQGQNVPGVYEYSAQGWILRNPQHNVLTYDVSGTVFGKPNAGDRVLMFVTPRTFEIEASYAGALASILTPPSIVQDYVVNVMRAQTYDTIGVIRFNPGETRGEFIPTYYNTSVKVYRGETLIVIAPFEIDPYAEDVSFTICGTLSV